jgi:acyl transferase domain-containing protein
VKRVVVLCPGRASYTSAQLGSLAGIDDTECAAELVETLARVDAARTARGETPVREMDAATRFSSSFLEGHNAAPLIFAVTAYEALRLDPGKVEVVAVGGNSMGWYSALWVAGALPLGEAFRLIETMGGMTRSGAIGGQVIYPVVDAEWRHAGEAEESVDEALRSVAAAGLQAGDSIRFGGFRVLWGEDAALERIVAALPQRDLGRQQYPVRLLGNSAFHSHLLRQVADQGQLELADLAISSPGRSLIDGRGRQWRPLGSAPAALLDYTLGHQVTRTFDFGAVVRVALREYAPDLVVALGPGESLGGAVAQVMIAEGWRGITDRREFLARQADDPVVVSMGRPEQAALVARES